MTSQILEISQSNRHLSLNRGFVSISQKQERLGQVPLANLEALVISGHSVTLSNSLLARLSEENIVSVLCGANYQPTSMVLPLNGHYQSAGTMWDQIEASEPLKKRLWQSVVKAKILNQARVLQVCTEEESTAKKLQQLARRVKSGDKDNLEAQAARLYWKKLFGKQFKRRREDPGVNTLLNYTYAILRASVSRSLVSSGLQPALGIHHKNRMNPFCLADDLIEPYRPYADLLVAEYVKSHKELDESLAPETKRHLVKVLHMLVKMPRGVSFLHQAIKHTSLTLRSSLQEKKNIIWLPELDRELQDDKRPENLD